MSLVTTWSEVAEYVTQSKGYDYLTNPTDWMNAFKEVVGDARYVSSDGGGSFIFKNPVDWIGVGKEIAPTLDSGIKSLPSVDTVVTDLSTGGAVAGATALATEKTGITIALSGAGWVATALAGFGLGVVGYELAPEFWTDLSNAVFEPITGEHLDYDETEPFLRKKLKTLLSTDSNGDIVTYADRNMLERAYNFIATHIQGEGYNFADDYTWNTYTPPNHPEYMHTQAQISNEIAQHPLQHDFIVGRTSLTDDMIQSCIHQVQLQKERSGLIEQEPSASGIVNNLRSLYPNYNNANVFQIFYYYNYTSPTVNTSFVCINGYNVQAQDDKIQGKFDGLRFLREGVNPAQAQNDDYGYEVAFEPDVLNWQDFLYSYKYDINSGTGTVIETGLPYFTFSPFGLGYISYSTTSQGMSPTNYVSILSNLQIDDGTLDSYLLRNGVTKTGKTPVGTKTYEERYNEWWNNHKDIAQPSNTGVNNVTPYVPSNIPATNTHTDTILRNGVNVGENSYNDSQDNTHQGKNTPNINPIDVVNDSIRDNIDDYNESKVSPETTPEPAPSPLPKYPETPPTEPTGDSGDTPTAPSIGGVTASGMVSVYNPTKQQLIDFSAWLWSPSFLDNFLKIFANPMDAIIGLHIMYATPISSGSEHIIAGYLDSNVSSKVVTQQYSKLDCGTIALPEYYGNATDYEPYTTVHIYLPFIGIMPLRANDIIGKRVHLEYGIDALTGTCLATITTIKDDSEISCYTFAGNCAVQIPVSGGNYAEMIKAISGFIVAGAGAIATGNPIMALGAGASFMSGNTSVQHSGAIGSNAGACGIRKPYIIITRKKSYDAQNYQHYYGFPANLHTKLSDCRGYTQVKSCHVESIYRATDNEKQEIESLLKEGVIII